MNDPIAEGRAAAEGFNGASGEGFKNVERKNAYVCDGSNGNFRGPGRTGCGAYIVTIDREPGVTPFIVRCGNCGGETHSKFYRVQEDLEPTHEWYRPETAEGLSEHTVEHIRKGGLILRPIPGKPDKWSNAISKDELQEQMAAKKRAIIAAEAGAKVLALLSGSAPIDKMPAETYLRREIDPQPSRQQRHYRKRNGGAA